MDLSLFKNKYPFSLKGLTKERNIYRSIATNLETLSDSFPLSK
jgi:hypothetical protein